MNNEILDILQGVKLGTISPEDALLELKKQPFKDIDFAKVDLHRKLRQGAAEVIYGAGKTSEQITKIVQTMIQFYEHSAHNRLYCNLAKTLRL